jgi:hypothetical protein
MLQFLRLTRVCQGLAGIALVSLWVNAQESSPMSTSAESVDETVQQNSGDQTPSAESVNSSDPAGAGQQSEFAVEPPDANLAPMQGESLPAEEAPPAMESDASAASQNSSSGSGESAQPGY